MIESIVLNLQHRAVGLLFGGAHQDESSEVENSTDQTQSSCLSGKRILLVEDEFFLSLLVEETLQSAGGEVVGPFTSLALALQASRHERFDLAVLDINLNGEMVYPLADELADRGIPFTFLTGYGTADLPGRYQVFPRVQKPYDRRALLDVLERIGSV